MGQNTGIQLKMLKRRPNEGGTGMCLRQDQVFCLVESQMVIFHFEEAGGWTQNGNDRKLHVISTCITRYGKFFL